MIDRLCTHEAALYGQGVREGVGVCGYVGVRVYTCVCACKGQLFTICLSTCRCVRACVCECVCLYLVINGDI